MALSATIYKTNLTIVDNNREYYAGHNLTIAQHPSETAERLMLRVVAYALLADKENQLSFTRGLSQADEPDLWSKDLTGSIQQWIEVGLPDDKRINKACGRAQELIIIAYGKATDQWWKKIATKISGKSVKVYAFDARETQALVKLVHRYIDLMVQIQDDEITLIGANGVSLSLTIKQLNKD